MSDLRAQAYNLADAGDRQGAVRLMRRAADAGDRAAKGQCGVWALFGWAGGQDVDGGAALLSEAAALGDPASLSVEASLLASGVRGAPDWPAARRALLAAARGGSLPALRVCGVAALLGGDAATARPLLRQAAVAGDATARVFLARALQKSGLARDKAEAAGWLAAARAAGDPVARRMPAPKTASKRIAMPPNEPVDWDVAANALRLPHDAPARALRQTSESPHVRVAQRALSQGWCDYLISLAAPLLLRATVNDATAGRIHDPSRSNKVAAFYALESDLAVRSVQAMMANAAGFDVARAEPLNVLAYAPGEEYRPHFDWFNPEWPAHQHDLSRYGQRVLTALIYLNEDFRGGETLFLATKYAFKGRTGDLIVFSNVDAAGAPDKSSLHAGRPVDAGEKWIVSQWVCDKPQGLRVPDDFR